jgi:hypothetical protein
VTTLCQKPKPVLSVKSPNLTKRSMISIAGIKYNMSETLIPRLEEEVSHPDTAYTLVFKFDNPDVFEKQNSSGRELTAVFYEHIADENWSYAYWTMDGPSSANLVCKTHPFANNEALIQSEAYAMLHLFDWLEAHNLMDTKVREAWVSSDPLPEATDQTREAFEFTQYANEFLGGMKGYITDLEFEEITQQFEMS